jgi:hypothetical protein
MTDYNQNYENEVTRLRLRLAEVELQRDAFKAMASHVLKDLIREVLAEQAGVSNHPNG